MAKAKAAGGGTGEGSRQPVQKWKSALAPKITAQQSVRSVTVKAKAESERAALEA
jgi:hypothetical protein